MIKVKLQESQNFDKQQLEKIQTCVSLIELAINSPEFKTDILNYFYIPSYTTGKLWWKKTIKGNPVYDFYFAPGEPYMNRQDIYDHICTGWEEGHPENNNVIDLYLTCKAAFWRSATAFGFPGNDEICVYDWWVNSASVPELCNTIFHEWLHNNGFDHDFAATPLRPYSVPYGVGKVIEEIIKEKLEAGEWKV